VARPVDETIRDLREARGDPRVGLALGMLLEAAEGHLSELHGPAFEAFRCDECGNIVTLETLRSWLGMDYDYRGEVEGQHNLRVELKGPEGLSNEALGRLLPPNYVECTWGDSEHGRMRRVVCRVTADDPSGYAAASNPDDGGGEACRRT
jgi:hypothetical protein